MDRNKWERDSTFTGGSIVLALVIAGVLLWWLL